MSTVIVGFEEYAEFGDREIRILAAWTARGRFRKRWVVAYQWARDFKSGER